MGDIKVINVNVNGLGNMRLESTAVDTYYVFNDQSVMLGEIVPEDIPDWNEDPHCLAAIIEDLIDNKSLELPFNDEDLYSLDE